jgi:hypothetical protein
MHEPEQKMCASFPSLLLPVARCLLPDLPAARCQI